MVRLIIVLLVIVVMLFIFRNRSKNISPNKFRNYNKIIVLVIVIGIIFLIATSGRFILPQILQIFKIALPFLTKFIGI